MDAVKKLGNISEGGGVLCCVYFTLSTIVDPVRKQRQQKAIRHYSQAAARIVLCLCQFAY